MATRTVSGVLRKPINNDLWTGAVVTFRLTRPFAISGATYPTQTVEVTSHATTAVITTVLAVPDSGSARYRCTLPNDHNFIFYLAAGVGTVNLEDLVAGAYATGDAPDSLQTIADNILADANEYTDTHAAVIASAGTLGHVRIGAGITIDGDGVISADSGGASAFVDLTDTPDSYAEGGPSDLVRINAAGDGLEFFTPPYALDGDLDAHVLATNNPHNVTAVQIGALRIAQNLADIDDPIVARDNLFLTPGTHVQAYSDTLKAIAGLTSAANKGIQFTGSGTAATFDLSAFALTLLDDANQGAMQATLGLVPGTNVQAQDAELSAIAGLTSAADRGIYFTGSGTADLFTLTAAGRALLDDADAAAQRTTLGLVDGGAGDIWVTKSGDTMTGPLLIPDGAVGAPAVAFSSSPTSGLYWTATGPTISIIGARRYIFGIASFNFERDTGTIVIGSSTSVTFGHEGSNILRMGNDTASPAAQTFKGANGSGTNIAGGSLAIAGGRGTGTGAGGVLNLQTAPAGASGSSANALVTAVQVDGQATGGDESRLLLLDLSDGTVKRVTFGADDSGGAGHKVLRVAN